MGGRDLTLAHGRGARGPGAVRARQPGRCGWWCPGAELESPSRVGQGKHLQVRLRSGGVHARAIGFRMGERVGGHRPRRAPRRARLARDRALAGRWSARGSRWRRSSSSPSARRPPGPVRPGLRRRLPRSGRRPGDLRALRRRPVTGPPAAARRRPPGRRSGCATGAARAPRWPCSPRSRAPTAASSPSSPTSPAAAAALEAALEPGRLGARGGGARRRPLRPGRPGAPASRCARGVPALLMLDYARLAEVEPPEGMHLVLVDPPAGAAEQAAWAVHRAAGRWLHLVWGEPETELALRVAEDEWELRPAVTAALDAACATAALRPWGPELERVLLGDGPTSRPPRVAARALRVLAEVGLVEVGERRRPRRHRPGAPRPRRLAPLPRVPGAPHRGPRLPRPRPDARRPRPRRAPRAARGGPRRLSPWAGTAGSFTP